MRRSSMAVERQNTAVVMQNQVLEGELLDEIMKETKIKPSDESYDIAKKGVEVFLSEIISSSHRKLPVEKT